MELILNYIVNFLKSVWSVINTIGLIDIIDILLLSLIIYKGWKVVRETRAAQLVKGIALLAFVYIIVDAIQLKTIAFLLQQVFSVGIFAIAVIFQPELRRVLEKFGRAKVSKLPFISLSQDPDDATARQQRAIEVVAESCEELSATTTGALIVFERETRLGEQIDTGTVINATPSRELFGNIFYPKTPLHDGAVIMRDGMILAAACFLPKPQKEELINKQLGSRHRAAIGMSENSDAIIVIVSEETGTVSVAENGDITRGYTKSSLKKYLTQKLIPEKPQAEPKIRKSLWGGDKK